MLETGQILQGRYQLSQQLGNNAGRQTWLALDIATQTREQVIVKLLPFSPQLHWEDLKLFEREAQVLKHLNHPHIPKYRDYFSTEPSKSDELPWFGLVQDYIPGISLQKRLKNGKRFTEAEAKEIATQLLNILIYLHELSPPVLHRDIKPSNIIWGKNGQVYLVDFGAVQEKAKAEGATFTVVGTGGYAPPEQLWGRAVPASDLYALGATLIHLLTGTAPVNLPQPQMRLQFGDQVSLSASFAHWLETLIEPAPELRFSNAHKALEALQANASPSPLEAAYTDAQETTPQNRQRVVDIAIVQYIIAFLVAIALPSTFSMVGRPKPAEGKNNLGAMNRAQQAYFIEYGEFTDSLEQLGIGIKPQTENYNYSIRTTPLAVFNYATPRKGGIKGYVGAVFLAADDQQTGEFLTVAIACEAKSPGITRPADPIVRGNSIECGSNTRDLASSRRLYETEHSDLGKDAIEAKRSNLDNSVELAYSSFNYANAGQYDKALEVAQSINNADFKARALATVAITLAEKGQYDKAVEVTKTVKDDSSKQMALDAIAHYQKSP
jgi:serine/threonine protein kinase